jgi:hypothetical protein
VNARVFDHFYRTDLFCTLRRSNDRATQLPVLLFPTTVPSIIRRVSDSEEAEFKSLGVSSKGVSAAMKETKAVPNDASVPEVATHGAAKVVVVVKGISDAHLPFEPFSLLTQLDGLHRFHSSFHCMKDPNVLKPVDVHITSHAYMYSMGWDGIYTYDCGTDAGPTPAPTLRPSLDSDPPSPVLFLRGWLVAATSASTIMTWCANTMRRPPAFPASEKPANSNTMQGASLGRTQKENWCEVKNDLVKIIALAWQCQASESCRDRS